MQVNDAAWVVIEQRLGNDLSEVCEERPLRTERLDSFSFCCVADLGGMYDSQSSAARPGVDRGRRECTASASGAWWCRYNSENGESRVCCDGAERRDRESATTK